MTEPLTLALRAFVAEWEEARPCEPYSGEFVPAMEWLAAQQKDLTENALWTIRRGRYATTALSTADALVSALGHPEWFHDGTLTVIPNPRSRPSATDCCGGSVAAPVAA